MTSTARSPWQTFADLLDPPENPYVRDPVGWVRDVLGEDLWSGQEWIARSVVDHRRIVVRSGHSTGKTRIISRLIAWFVSVHPIDEVRVVITADNFNQITGGIWRELVLLHQQREELARTSNMPALALPGKVTMDAKWHAGTGDKVEVAAGIKPADKNPTGLQGRHARHLLVILEECCGIPRDIWDAADSLASNEGATVLAVGNPTDPTAYMAEVCKPGFGWVTKRIASVDTPEFTGEAVSDELRGVLASKSWVEGRKHAWGETSPQFISRILGEFPDVSDDTLIQPKWIDAAQKRSLPRTRKPKLGIDIARYGSDESVIMRREGGWVRLHTALRHTDTMTTAGHIAKAITDINAERENQDWVETALDEVGVGGGVLDRLLELGYDVVGLRAGDKAYDDERFANAKAEWYWMVRDIFEAGEIDIDPLDDALAAQLGSIKWDLDSRGRIKIESKDDARKRGLPSPDRAESLIMSFVESASILTEDPLTATPTKTITGDLLDMQW